MELSIKTNFPQVAQALRGMHDDVAGLALASAMNKTIALARTEMTREIPAEFNVKAGYVRERLRVKRAVGRPGVLALEAYLAATNPKGRSANIIAFVEGSTTLAQARKRAKAGTLGRVYVKIKRQGGKKPLNARTFIGNKGRTVFERTGKGRLPIEPVRTIDVSQMFNTKRINARVVQLMLERFPDLFAREARFFVDRAAARAEAASRGVA